MFNKKRTCYLKALSPIHVGAGETLSSVDLPIQREKHTHFPKIEGSSLKGALKHTIYHRVKDTKDGLEALYRVFGDEGAKQASEIAITDAKLLFFPVRASLDIYMLITCPYVLKRYASESNNKELAKVLVDNLEIADDEILAHKKKGEVYLEEYAFSIKECSSELDLKALIPFELDTQRVGVVSNEAFKDMVTMYTEIITRNSIDVKTGAAKSTGLFTEEYLPAESILYFNICQSATFACTSNEMGALGYLDELSIEIFQVGANETIGKGFVQLVPQKEA